MKFESENKNRKRISSKQLTAQRLKLKARVKAGAAFIVLLFLGITMYLNFSNSDKSKAGTHQVPAWTIVKEPDYVKAMSLDAPVITHAPVAKYTMQFRIPKAQMGHQ